MNWKKILAGIGLVGSNLLGGNLNAQELKDKYNISFKDNTGDDISLEGTDVDTREVTVKPGKYTIGAPGQIIYRAILEDRIKGEITHASFFNGEKVGDKNLQPLLDDESVDLDLTPGTYILKLKYLKTNTRPDDKDTLEIKVGGESTTDRKEVASATPSYEDDFRIKLIKNDDPSLTDLVTKVDIDKGKVKIQPGDYVIPSNGQFVVSAELTKNNKGYETEIESAQKFYGETETTDNGIFKSLIDDDESVNLRFRESGDYIVRLVYAKNVSTTDVIDEDILEIKVEEETRAKVKVADKSREEPKGDRDINLNEEDKKPLSDYIDAGIVARLGGTTPTMLGLMYDKNTLGRSGAVRGAVGGNLQLTNLLKLKGYLFGQASGTGGLNTEDSLSEDYLPVGASLNEQTSGEGGVHIKLEIGTDKYMNLEYNLSGFTNKSDSDFEIGNLPIQKEIAERGLREGLYFGAKLKSNNLWYVLNLKTDSENIDLDQKTYLLDKGEKQVYNHSHGELTNEHNLLNAVLEFEDTNIGLGVNSYNRDLIVSGNKPHKIEGYNVQIQGGSKLPDNYGTLSGTLAVPLPNQDFSKGWLSVRYSKQFEHERNNAWFAECGVSTTKYDTRRNVHENIEANCSIGVSTGDKDLEERLEFSDNTYE